MSRQPLVGVLSTLTAPLLPHLLRCLYDVGITNLCVIADEKPLTPKNQKIWQQRTAGAFDSTEIGLYDFGGNNLTYYLVKNHNGDDCLSILEKIRPALLINGGTPRKLTSPILDFPDFGVINVHPGILPKYRGSCCVEWAILNDDPIGNTAHFMTLNYDEGPIIHSELCSFTSLDTYISMRVQVYSQANLLMANTVNMVLRRKMTPADGIQQGGGTLFPPVNEAQMQEVLKKIRSGSYSHIISSTDAKGGICL